MLTMNKKYFEIQLTSTDGYFFGGEKNFRSGAEEYLAESKPFPQQTAVLGMLRHTLLIQNNLLTDNKVNKEELAISLIGSGTYKLGEKWENSGVISTISPIFVANNNETFRKVEITGQLDLEVHQNGKVLLANKQESNSIFVLPKYDAKNGINEQFISNMSLKAQTELFETQTRVGIQKKLRNETMKDGAFYKQTFYNLNNKLNLFFKFYVELIENDVWKFTTVGEDGNSIKLLNGTITMGAERSVFKFKVKEINNLPNLEQLFPKPESNYPALILLSDGFIAEEALNKPLFVAGQIKEFRQITTKTKSNFNFTNIKLNDIGVLTPSKSELYKILEAGSVCFFKNEIDREAMANYLKQTNEFNIGLNHFILSK